MAKQIGVYTKLYNADPEKCTGCFQCQLACSFAFTKGFNPEDAKLIVNRTFKKDIIFKPECVDCTICAQACAFGALRLN